MPILKVSSGLISKWKKAFFQSGVEGLKLAHKGSFGLLNAEQRSSIIEWLLTKGFLEYLQSQRRRAKILIIWDGASYHCSGQIKEYLDSLNAELEREQWLITCERFAPNAPQQNPLEDIWLQAKRLIREFYFFCHSFSVVKGLFELAIDCQIFDFPKLHEYGVFS